MLVAVSDFMVRKIKAALIYQLICSVLLSFIISFNAAGEEKINNTEFVILVYHHVSNETPPSTSISPELFAEHVDYLSKNHTVISLESALTAMEANTALPEKSVVITFDDGYANIFEHGFPLLKQYNFPFTIFINPEEIGNREDQLTWQQIAKMQPLGTFANHTIGHHHLLDRKHSENEQAWLKRTTANITLAEKKIREQLGYTKRWLAYPYGEHNEALKKHIIEIDFTGFGQHSGAVASFSDKGAIPRFPAAGIYADLASLKVKLNSLALPVKAVTPSDPEVKPGEYLDKISLYLLETSDIQLQQLTCFFRNEPIEPVIADKSIEIDFKQTLLPGRHRINCTAPSISQKGRYYWHSIPLFVPTEDGFFLD
ncbi:MAG: polysaccharide deacetylase family protein [Pseudomonadota bacterium]